jgi:cytochrome P450
VVGTELMCRLNRIEKGETVIIPISFINASPEIWGEDAHEFK